MENGMWESFLDLCLVESEGVTEPPQSIGVVADKNKIRFDKIVSAKLVTAEALKTVGESELISIFYAYRFMVNFIL